jgi:hypothetical protein
MSTHWVEVWSPGLQAVGGTVELIGVFLLAYEWWQSLEDTIDSAVISKKALIVEKLGIKSGDAWRKILAKERAVAETKRNKVLARLKTINVSIDGDKISDDFLLSLLLARARRKVYVRGFFLAVFGVMLQISANVIGWLNALSVLL